MTLDQYIKEQQTALKKFRQYWKDGQREDPETFPEVLPAGDWDEQFQLFVPPTKDLM
jgi:hypothetical protein